MVRPTLLRPFLVAVIAALLVSAPALASSGACGLAAPLFELHQGADQVIFDPELPPAADLLFLALPPWLHLESGDRLRFEVSAGAAPFLIETVELAPPEAKPETRPLLSNEPGAAPASEGMVIELLSRHAVERAYLHELSRQSEIEVVGFWGGSEVVRLSFAELLAARAGLGDHALPRPVDSELQVGQQVFAPLPGAGEVKPALHQRNSCLANCDAEYWDCYAYRCDYTPCSYCYDQQAACYAGCGFCTPTSTTVTERVLVSVTPVAGAARRCYLITAYPPGTTVELTDYRYKTTTKRINRNSDCSVTETILSVSYSTTRCYRPLVNPCGGWQNPVNLCQ